MTIDYYNQNADAFAQRTMGTDLDEQYRPFLAMLPARGHILDAGCGPGRDSAAFLKRDYHVTSIDASSAMVELARRATGETALLLRFDQIDFHERFDGVWANASLLHVAPDQIDDALVRLTRSLKPGGAMYMSVKVGDGPRVSDDGRYFCDYTAQSLRAMLARHPLLELVDLHEAPPWPRQPDGKAWLRALLRKATAA